MKNMKQKTLIEISEDRELMEIGRRAVEDQLIEMRDSGMFCLRNNGLVCKHKDGSTSHIIRMGTDQAVVIALRAISEHLNKK